jgi:hypothetical protein
MIEVFWRELAPETLWVVEHPLRAHRLELGRRMTVIRLASGQVWLHSVAQLVPEVEERLERIGSPGFIVAPNRFHHAWVEEYVARFPGAELWAAPGLPEKRSDLEFHGVLGQSRGSPWSEELDFHVFGGSARLGEVVFLHRPSRTLVLTDLCFNLPATGPILTRIAARLLGTYRRFAVSRLVRAAIDDRHAARRSVERILDWDFDRIIIGHGDLVESGGKDAMRKAFRGLLEP